MTAAAATTVSASRAEPFRLWPRATCARLVQLGDDGGGANDALSGTAPADPRTDAEREFDAEHAAHHRWADADSMRCTIAARTLREKLSTTSRALSSVTDAADRDADADADAGADAGAGADSDAAADDARKASAQAAADALRHTYDTLAASTPGVSDQTYFSWRDLVHLASASEDALLRGSYKLGVRPLASNPHEKSVRVLGVSALWAVAAARHGVQARVEPAATADAKAGAAASAAASAADTDADAPVALYVCPIERSLSLAWRETDRARAPHFRPSSLRACAAWGSEMVLCWREDASPSSPSSSSLHVAVLNLPECTTASMRARLVDDATDSADAAPVFCALANEFVAVARGRRLHVWQRSSAQLPFEQSEEPFDEQAPVRSASYEHAHALTCVRLDASTRAGSRLLLCGDARGGLLGFELALGGASAPLFARAPFYVCASTAGEIEAQRYIVGSAECGTAPSLQEALGAAPQPRVVALAFAGSRFAVATETHLHVRDTQRVPGAGVPGTGRAGTLDHACTWHELGLAAPPVSLAMWGEVLLVHDAESRVAIIDARLVRDTRPNAPAASAPESAPESTPVPRPRQVLRDAMRANVPRATGFPYQSLVVACDQAALLMPHGVLLLFNVEA